MTLAPLIRLDIRGVEGKPVELGAWCVVPGCLSRAQQRHHYWPKSYLRGQPFEWVRVGERTIPNSGGVCIRHHNWVTGEPGGHRAEIRWNDELELLTWWERTPRGEMEYVGPLKGQTLVGRHPPEVRRPHRQEGLCPTCGRVKAPSKTTKLPPRATKTWSILVPDDAEVGADVLDVYVEDLGVLMGMAPELSPRLLRFHVLVPVLEWVMQSRVEFLADWEDTT